ncbi:outer membrane protein assembly factor BamB family protein [Halanaerobacter jeridensis]|uniref:Outer membrane protein assembly factor BamB n=1 Tax=Halanaerobacter jeridensis TaxID=706427 RepID=A0A938XPC5_9FIRM|nr:PQQ-binding-like beta-propeller repeat protein [Halanaerobacter jeridensis]MBM7556738.1 outer membrane protein assembly factor BamB [Halanaerobacter jeridensis]
MIIKWKYESKGRIEAGAAIDNDTIYIGDKQGFLYAIDTSGQCKWKFDSGGEIISTPVIANNGDIYIKVNKLNDYQLQAVTAAGNCKWQLSVGLSGKDSPAIGKEGTIYLEGFKLHAISPEGQQLWAVELDAGNISSASPVIDKQGIIYVRSDQQPKLYAVNKRGRQKWQYKLSEGSFWGDAVIDQQGTIYVGSSKLHTLNQEGQEKWNYTPQKWITSNIVLGNDTIYFGAGEKLYAVNRSGNLKWSFKTAADILRSPVLANDDLIYVVSDKLYVLNKRGKKVKELETGDFLGEAVLDKEGTIYVGSGNQLYAVSDQNGGLADSPWPVVGQNLKHTSCNTDFYREEQVALDN